jgi:hypothetical protein
MKKNKMKTLFIILFYFILFHNLILERREINHNEFNNK